MNIKMVAIKVKDVDFSFSFSYIVSYFLNSLFLVIFPFFILSSVLFDFEYVQELHILREYWKREKINVV